MIMIEMALIDRLKTFIESEGKSYSFEPELITPEYVYRMWGGEVAMDDIEWAMSALPQDQESLSTVRKDECCRFNYCNSN